MNWLSMLGGQQQPQTMDNPMQAQQAYQRAMEQQARAQQMQQSVPNFQGGGAAGWVSLLANMLGGRKLEARADESVSQALSKMQEFDTAAKQQQQQEAMAAEEKKFQRELERDRRKQEEIAKNRDKSPEFQNGFWVDKSTGKTTPVPEYLAAQEKLRAAGRTSVTVNGNGLPPTGFEKALDKKDAEFYDTLRTQAQSAAGTLDNLKIIKGVLQNTQTGKTQELLAQAGQYLGTDLGTDMQTFNVAARPLFLNMAEQMKGALSDKDREILQQASPSFGIDPKANAVVIGILERAANRAQSTFADADAYAQKNRGLRGWSPATAAPSAASATNGPPAGGAPAPGTVVDGKRFKGGDPYNPASWE